MATSVNAEMYKHTDSQGVTTYTDIQVEGATEITPPEGNTIKLPRQAPGKKPSVEQKSYHYDFLTINSPQNDAVIRDNTGSFQVTLSLQPELETGDGHHISVSVDGQLSVAKSTTLSVTLSNIDRGTHTIIAQVRDAEARTLIQSNAVTVHVKRFSSLH